MRVLILIAALTIAAPVLADTAIEQQARIEALEQSILAPCCYTEPVATHRSDAAFAVKAEITEMVKGGRSDQEIRDYYTSRYGKRILLEPEGGLFWLMNAVPIGAALLGVVVVAFMLRRWLKPIPSS